MFTNRAFFSFLAISANLVTLTSAHAEPAQVTSLLQSTSSISQGEAIEKVKAALKSERYIEPNSSAPQANDRHGLNGCTVTVFDIGGPYAQLLVVVSPPGKLDSSTRIDLMNPDDFNTPVKIREEDGKLELAYHRHGQDDDGYWTNEIGYIMIADDGNLVTVSDRKNTRTCKFQ